MGSVTGLVDWTGGIGCSKGCAGAISLEVEISTRKAKKDTPAKVKGKGEGSIPGEIQKKDGGLPG